MLCIKKLEQNQWLNFYGVVWHQEMDGGQSLKVLSERVKVDWCFPPILDCERALDVMTK